MNNNPIGILDSGVGGLTVLQAVIEELPGESIIYIGDSQNTPYGAKKPEAIYHLAKRMIEVLKAKNVKLIVIACNTITVSCMDRLRTDYPNIPLIGTVPVIKTAAKISENKRIGILSTTITAKSDYQNHLIEEFADGCTVFNHGNDKLVPLIEKGLITSTEMSEVLYPVLAPFLKEEIDTLVLGCTHFPFVKSQIQEFLGQHVTLLDSSGAVARQVKRVLQHNDILATDKPQKVIIYTTGNKQIVQHLWDSLALAEQVNIETLR